MILQGHQGLYFIVLYLYATTTLTLLSITRGSLLSGEIGAVWSSSLSTHTKNYYLYLLLFRERDGNMFSKGFNLFLCKHCQSNAQSLSVPTSAPCFYTATRLTCQMDRADLSRVIWTQVSWVSNRWAHQVRSPQLLWPPPPPALSAQWEQALCVNIKTSLN